MLLCTGPRFRCCLVLIALQVTIYSVFVLRLLQQKNVSTTTEYSSNADDAFETLSYENGEINITESKTEEECVWNYMEGYSNYCAKALVPPASVLRRLVHSDSRWANKDLCPCIPANLSGRVNLNFSSVRLSADIFTGMVPGGHWSPSSCIPRQRIAIIVPFRERASHLDTFLQVFHPFLQKQLLSYSIFVIEQVKPSVFNKAALMNAGFKEIVKRTERIFDCYIFHDIDTYPEDDRNFYGCYKLPKHVAAYVSKLRYRLMYWRMFGGATAFTRRQFEASNGYSNEYYGWGGEDDDMEKRISAANMSFLRFPICVAKYTVFKHERDAGNPANPQAARGWIYRPHLYHRDGLNTLVYSLDSYEERLLYTRIAIALPSTAPPLLTVLPPTQPVTLPATTTTTTTSKPSSTPSTSSPALTHESPSNKSLPEAKLEEKQQNVSESRVASPVLKNNSLAHS